VTGKHSRQKEKGKGQKSEAAVSSPFSFFLFPFSFPRDRRGFTLLELMIVISVIIILALIVMPLYNRTVQAAKEAVLRENLQQMRKMIDQYAADKGKLPSSGQDLVTAGYLHAIPDDPTTQNEGDDWNWVMGDDPNLGEGGSGLVNVCSSSGDNDSQGVPYNNCDKW
jgi:general secretion pathway protein G